MGKFNIFLLLLVFVVLSISACTNVASNDDSSSNDKVNVVNTTTDMDTTEKIPKDHFKTPLFCNKEIKDGDYKVYNQFYLHEKEALEIISTTNPAIGPSNHVYTPDTKNVYMWDTDTNKGIIVVSYDARSSFDLLGKTKYDEFYNMVLDSDYTCTPWTYDSTLFNIPKDVDFTDLTQGNDILSPI